MKKKTVAVTDKMQRGYRYELSAPVGRGFDPEFKPDLTPAEMLRLGIFGGKYMTDCAKEFPKSWFAHAKLAKKTRDNSLNYFGIDASQPLSVWRKKGWIFRDDPRGWFQWYCRYYMGRRATDQALENDPPTRPADRTQLRARRRALPAATAAGFAALGLRQPENLSVGKYSLDHQDDRRITSLPQA